MALALAVLALAATYHVRLVDTVESAGVVCAGAGATSVFASVDQCRRFVYSAEKVFAGEKGSKKVTAIELKSRTPAFSKLW